MLPQRPSFGRFWAESNPLLRIELTTCITLNVL